MTQAIIVAIIGGLLGGGAIAALITGVFQYRRTRAEARKVHADADRQTIDTANDAVALVEKVYEARMAKAEADIAELQAGRAVDRRTIIDLNQRVGNLMQSGEAQSKQIKLWRERVEELLCILRSNGIPLPAWAQPGCGDK